MSGVVAALIQSVGVMSILGGGLMGPIVGELTERVSMVRMTSRADAAGVSALGEWEWIAASKLAFKVSWCVCALAAA
jgi:hypothetical protein